MGMPREGEIVEGLLKDSTTQVYVVPKCNGSSKLIHMSTISAHLNAAVESEGCQSTNPTCEATARYGVVGSLSPESPGQHACTYIWRVSV